MSSHCILMFIYSLIAVISSVSASDLARGFNEKIDWVNLEDGLKLSKERNKPIMMLIHKSWCGACKALGPKFSDSKEIEELSQNFVMVNIRDDEEPPEKKYSPDGGYIPRILFLDTDGEVQTQYYNEDGSADYKYYYPDPNQIHKAMKRVLEGKPQEKVVTDEL